MHAPMRAAPRAPPTAPPTVAVLRRSEAQRSNGEMVGVEVNGVPVDTAVPATWVGSVEGD